MQQGSRTVPHLLNTCACRSAACLLVLQRWNHHLHPDIRKDAWTEAEEQQLVAAHRQLGNKWSDIARRLPGTPATLLHAMHTMPASLS